MKKILTYKGAVMTWECDSNHHMNVMYYINKFEHAGRHFIMEMGLTTYLRINDFGVVTLEQNIKYLKEVIEDDLLFIESSLVTIGNKAFTIYHEMHDSSTQKIVSTMKGTFVLFDKVERKSLPFPKDQKERLLKSLS